MRKRHREIACYIDRGSVMLRRWVAPVCFLLALLVALGGVVRAADVPDDADEDDIVLASDDGVCTLHGAPQIQPPDASTRAFPPLPAPPHGRRMMSELFRPPRAR